MERHRFTGEGFLVGTLQDNGEAHEQKHTVHREQREQGSVWNYGGLKRSNATPSSEVTLQQSEG